MKVWLCLIMTLACPVLGQEARVTLHDTVSGNREQPRVMYILPWQQPEDVSFAGRPGGDRPGDLFGPLDRDDFRRELRYQQALGSASVAAKSAAVEAGATLTNE